jgi:hypothetical protein
VLLCLHFWLYCENSDIIVQLTVPFLSIVLLIHLHQLLYICSLQLYTVKSLLFSYIEIYPSRTILKSYINLHPLMTSMGI